ncbi:hypothetical protein HMI56_003758 [Coelomomyces lativittatus]|nr:hypothetical protein HMI56_003758 [Coelomomyces lativittatus]
MRERPPHSISHVVLGTSLLWFGWSGFNAGSEGAANARASLALITTYLAACMGGLVWFFLEYVRERRVSALGFCSGVVSGLVCVTPACGFIGPASSLVFGSLGGFFCFFAVQMKHRWLLDDTLDVFTIHGLGGMLGCFLTGIFAEPYFIGMSGVMKPGGAIAGHPMQILYQLAGIGAATGWAFVVTLFILFLFKFLGLNLRVTQEQEEAGIDHSQMGEFTFDYIRERVTSSLDLLRAGTTSNSSNPPKSEIPLKQIPESTLPLPSGP